MPVEPRSPAACMRSSMKNEPLEGNLHYGTEDREFLDRNPIQPDLLPTELNLLRWKLNQKAKPEPKFRFSEPRLWVVCMPMVTRLQESRTVEISVYGLTRGVELNIHSYSTELPFQETLAGKLFLFPSFFPNGNDSG